jgi:hypothetical protein
MLPLVSSDNTEKISMEIVVRLCVGYSVMVPEMLHEL